jgi:long-chain alkane monooxygenase
LTRIVVPDGLEAVVDLLVPELQSRGVFKTQYAPGPSRQKIFGHPRLPEGHPAARYRFTDAPDGRAAEEGP